MSTRLALHGIEGNLEESLGRRTEESSPRLSPVPLGKDAGRRPVRGFGQIDIGQVIPDPDQPRIDFEPDAIDRLARSIREKGQLHPIRVRWSQERQKWVIIAGERRWRAAQQAGLATIECCFVEDRLTKSEVLEQQLIENLLREDLKPMEEARAFASLLQLNGWTAKQLAESLRLDPSKVSRSLALLRLPNEIQTQVEAGELPARSAYEIGKVQNQKTQQELARQAAAGKLTHQQAAKAARQRRGRKRAHSHSTHRTFIAERGYKVLVTAPTRGTYHDIRHALQLALDEVDHCIANNVGFF